MTLHAPRVLRASATWVIAAAFSLAVTSIVLVTTLQRRADSARDAQVTLAQIEREFDALQSVPYDTIGATAAVQEAVVRRMRAEERQVARRLAELRRSASSPHLNRAITAYPANFAVLEEIRTLLVRDQQDRSDALGPVAGRLQRAVNVELDRAGLDYRQRAAKSLRWATRGSAGAILALVSLFGVFYIRSRNAHAHSEQLAHENARLQLQEAQLQVIHRLARAAEYRDDQTGQHTRRVGDLAADIATALGMPGEQLDLLREAAPLHDVGKIGIPDSILLKPGRLTEGEFEHMKSHTTLGARMLAGGRGLPLLEMAEEIALTHHERWDGSGYPGGLAGAAIPLVGRIVAVADVFDALTHSRPYKEAWTLRDAVTEISAQAGRQFDPVVVEAFLRCQAEHPSWDGDEDAGITETRRVARAISASTAS
jgi:HD-GYP domain-containing protein (c-di-GMP phosphodiesterase class II)